MNLAEQLEQNEKYEEAYAEYKKMLAKKADDIELLTKLAHLAMILEKREDAKTYYAKILELDHILEMQLMKGALKLCILSVLEKGSL